MTVLSVNARWIFLLPLETHLIEQLLEFRQYHYDGCESSTTNIGYLQSLLLETPSPKVLKKTSHMHRNRLVTATASSASVEVMALPSFGSFGQAVSEEKIF
jgi:hypothetical protein